MTEYKLSEENLKDLKDRYISNGLIIGILAGGFIGSFPTLMHLFGNRDHIIPRSDNIENECIDTKNLKFELEDLNGNGELETIVNVNGKNYLLKYDETKTPKFYPYQVKVELK